MFHLLVVAGFLLVAQPLPEADIIISSECSQAGGADCQTIVWQLEVNGHSLTSGDFTQLECDYLRGVILPGLVLADPNLQPECVPYAVKRESL